MLDGNLSAIPKWLSSHGFALSDLQYWNISVGHDHLWIPTYSPLGILVFHIQRNFAPDAVRYEYFPKGCRTNVVLYGYHRAIGSIARYRFAVLVEGFSDVIALHKAGVANSVAVLGSFASNAQLALAALFADFLVVFSDGDAAGVEFAIRTGNRSPIPTIGLSIAGVDPAEFGAQGGDLYRAVWLAADNVGSYSFIELNQKLELGAAVCHQEDSSFSSEVRNGR